MADEEKKKKSFLDAAIDALTNRDEKAAEEAAKVEAARKEAEAAQLKAQAAAQAAEAKMKMEEAEAKAKAEKAAAEAKAAAEKAAAEAKAAAEKKAAEAAKAKEITEKYAASAQAMKEKAAEEAAIKAATVKHVWGKEDTYASLAFKHYGSIKEPFWRLIYEHNKAIIGDHPNAIREGLEIEIPPLPDELKK